MRISEPPALFLSTPEASVATHRAETHAHFCLISHSLINNINNVDVNSYSRNDKTVWGDLEKSSILHKNYKLCWTRKCANPPTGVVSFWFHL